MSKDRAPKPQGAVPETGDAYVSGPGGPTVTQGGIMPGGPEMEGWKRPVKDELQMEPEEPLEEQARNVRKLADEAKNK